MGRPARKEELLKQAARVFSMRGFHGATVREIAERTGMLSGSLYAHVAAKEDLLLEIMVRAGRQFTAAVEPIAASPGPASERLRQALRAHLRVVADSIDEATVFLHEWKVLSPDRKERVTALRNAYEALWEQILHDGVRSGEFRPLDVKFARLMVLSVANWAYHWFQPDGPLSADAVADRFADLILYGLVGAAGKGQGLAGQARQPGDGRKTADGQASGMAPAASAGRTALRTGRRSGRAPGAPGRPGAPRGSGTP